MKKIFKIFLVVALMLSFSSMVSAAKPGIMEVVSDVNIEQGKIVSQSGSDFKISFHIVNKDSSLSGLKYGVKLVKIVDKKQFVADDYVYSETLNLLPNSNITKEINYKAPANISGDYSILVSLQNNNGTPLGLLFIGKATLTASSLGLEILPETCYLNVSGDKTNSKYNLLQGVDIKDTESLLLNCKVVNKGDVITLTPSYETHSRSVYSDIAKTTGGDATPISFAKGESKVLALTLPKAISPQAYDVVFTLKSKDVSTNSITAHYVLKGLSATINNLILDKTSYSKGDKAKLSFSWAPSADNFPGSRYESTNTGAITLELTLKDSFKNCINPINKVLDKSGTISLDADIVSSCKNPTANVTLKDSSGKILATDKISFGVEESGKISNVLVKVIVTFGLLIVVCLVIYFINLKKNKKENETTLQ